MLRAISEFVRTHEKTLVVFFVLLFVLLRLPGVDRPLHQDEYKWPMMTNPTYVSEISIPHPPLSEFIYRTAGHIVGYDVDFRYIPLFFGTLNLLLLYIFMRMLYDRRTAVIAALIWSISYFSILASLMVDTDGEILPFFFLLALIGYEKLKRAPAALRLRWGVFLVTACVLGMLVKLSFVLAIGAITADFLWSQKHLITKKDIVRYAGYTIAAAFALALLLLAAPYIFPFFHLDQSFAHWEHYLKVHRGWFQTAIQCAKATLYASPLLLVPFFASKRALLPLRPLFFFLGFAFLFYIVIFDFSDGALDRYLQLIILPLTLLSAAATVAVFRDEAQRPSDATITYVLAGCVAALAVVLLQFIPHYIPPLHPKSDWLYRVLTLKWSFVFPFHGGSGPLGFYVSFLYMGLSWIISMFALFFAYRKVAQKNLLAFLIPIVLMYNIVFIEEYHFGLINGSAPKLLAGAVEFMKNNDEIKQVVTYNDNGGDEIMRLGKYERRLYVAPMFKNDATAIVFNNHVFQLDVPLPPNGAYWNSFDACTIIYKATDKKMSATIYDCRKNGVTDL